MERVTGIRYTQINRSSDAHDCFRSSGQRQAKPFSLCLSPCAHRVLVGLPQLDAQHNVSVSRIRRFPVEMTDDELGLRVEDSLVRRNFASWRPAPDRLSNHKP